ncbi:d935a4be-9d28-496b-9f39-ca3d7cd40f8b [Thermothielavioides terrestris]|uniref:D935a4be-9d28-496b-9f39-ca3d7cd40f8b n=1 Tax=Thermothielavioides terrestris TaxID=2587410 RepID=A0A3S4F2Z5_9PEZI|nr:d935a4be-9d28-496b-9f39-ca3d7cd40f8b [Thermothielavioides terrestris]
MPMSGLYDDPFAYDGPDFTTYLGQNQFAAGSSPDDFHVTSATETHFPAAVHALKPAPQLQQHHQPPRPLCAHQLPPGSADTTTRATAPSQHQHDGPDLEHHYHRRRRPHLRPGPSNPDPRGTGPQQPPANAEDLHSMLAALQAELRQTALERDEARLQLSTARNELYAARQIERRLRVERDEARSQADFLGAERAKARQTEARLRRERNEARLALLLKKDRGRWCWCWGRGWCWGSWGIAVMGGGGMESQGEESGESPPMVLAGHDQG